MYFNPFLGNNMKKPDNFITRIIQPSIAYMKEKKRCIFINPVKVISIKLHQVVTNVEIAYCKISQKKQEQKGTKLCH